jgi:hypothetical protein
VASTLANFVQRNHDSTSLPPYDPLFSRGEPVVVVVGERSMDWMFEKKHKDRFIWLGMGSDHPA